MSREQFDNNSYSYLSSSVNATVTSFSVDNGNAYPSTGQFHARVGDEIVLVTDVSSNTLTVERGQENTSAASHTSNSLVIQILSNEAFEKFIKDNVLYAFNKPAEGRLIDQNGNSLSLADFTWLNQGSATASENGDTITIESPLSTSVDVRGLYISAPTGNFTTTLSAVISNSLDRYGFESASHGGLFLRESSSNKIVAFSTTLASEHSAVRMNVRKYSDASTLNSIYSGSFSLSVGNSVRKYQRIIYDGSNYTFELSADGVNWTTAFTKADNDYFSLKADQIGFYADINTRNDGDPIKISASHFVVE